MRLIQLSAVLPVISLVAAANVHQQERRGEGHVQLVARQRSSGVLGPLVGDDEDETTVSLLQQVTADELHACPSLDRLLTPSVRSLFTSINDCNRSYSSSYSHDIR